MEYLRKISIALYSQIGNQLCETLSLSRKPLCRELMTDCRSCELCFMSCRTLLPILLVVSDATTAKVSDFHILGHPKSKLLRAAVTCKSSASTDRSRGHCRQCKAHDCNSACFASIDGGMGPASSIIRTMRECGALLTLVTYMT